MAEEWVRLLTRWTEAGVLDEEAASRIRTFELTHVESHRWRWPMWLALAFGAVTLSAGVLLFVSAHWDDIPPASRFAVVILLVSVFHLAGAASRQRFPPLSMALHAVGTLSLGAGIFLAGQIFNLDEHWPGGLMLWTLGAAIAWGLLREWPQLALLALLGPAWLVGEWTVAIMDAGSPAGGYRIATSGLALLALAYLTVAGSEPIDIRRRTLTWLGGVSLLPAAAALALASLDGPSSGSPLSARLQLEGWSVALGLPLAVAALFRKTAAWPNAVALLWIVALVNLRPLAGETSVYLWWAIGATALAAWGVWEARTERINLGAAIFGATVMAFYFSHVMDKLERSASLIGLGLLFLSGGWAIEHVRRRLVWQTRGGHTS